MLVDREVVLIYTLGFFIYFNIKVALFFAFFKYAKKLSNRKKYLQECKTEEISEEELKAWYEKSTFKRISKIKYSEDMASMMKRVLKSSKTSSSSSGPNFKIGNNDFSPPFKVQLGGLSLITGANKKIEESRKNDDKNKLENKTDNDEVNLKKIS